MKMTDDKETIETTRDYIKIREPESMEALSGFIEQFLNPQG